jgi:tetratricopeptide (TPR) repeat protein
MFRDWIAGGRLVVVPATLAWWVARRDSATIRVIVHRSDSIARSAPTEVDRNIGRFTAQAAQAYLALIRHDTATAIHRLEALPDSLCPLCYVQRLTLAQLLSARQEDRKAAELLDHWLIELTVPSDVLWTLERGRVAERMGDRDKAIHAYQYVADVWRHADAELQPYVSEAKEGLVRMTREPTGQ